MTPKLVHDIIKIKYVSEGYLPYYPCHLISDKEMFEAFLGETIIEGHDHLERNASFLQDHYPLPDPMLRSEYDNLVDEMRYHIKQYLETDKEYTVPNWVYSYMQGIVINNHSSVEDKHYLLTMLQMDNLFDELTLPEYTEILKVSKKWILKSSEDRKPTMFGEPHVIKSLRLQLVDSMY